MYRYYDIHTHHQARNPDCLQIVNVHEHFLQVSAMSAYSMGLHPWYLENYKTAFTDLEQAATLPHVVAIGESGLDKVCATEWNLQLKVFQWQIELAEKAKKPLVVHCVRAFEEVMHTLSKHSITVPVLFHGFNKKGVAEKLIDIGYYLSFGASILSVEGPSVAALKGIPADRFFLETDDSGKPIADIYQRAAIIRETSVEAIILQVQKNVQTVFNL
jgi:TatD DNase family protein